MHDHNSINPTTPPNRPKSSAGPLVIMVITLYGVALALALVLLARGRIAEGIVGILLVLTLAPIAFVLASHAIDRRTRSALDRIDDLSRNVRTLVDHASLSNDARRVLNRQGERDLLRQAIEEDIHMQNWDAAMVLVKELAENFGYRADAEEFRRKIEAARAETLEREVSDAITALDSLIIQRRWNDANAEAGRIQRLFPYSPRAENLRARVQHAQNSYKLDLERRFLLAAQEQRAEDALNLLKELDFYLTPSEAEPLREVARGVIGKARDNLGAQFKLAVQDRRWGEAVRIGEDIIEQFPNSRMAGEVRNVIDGLRSRANQNPSTASA